MSTACVGMAWYSDEGHYQQIKGMAADAEVLSETFQQWLKGAEAAEGELKKKGLLVIRIPLMLPRFAEWCREKKLKMNGEARTRFAAEGVQKFTTGL
ncbi:MAG: hypothetical protein AABZ53_16140, partial [Planctomycetota bacterium]